MIRYGKGILVSGLIYFHRISDATVEGTMKGTPLRNWRAFEKICGDHFNQVVLATTMRGDVDKNVGIGRVQELEDFWKANKARGWSMQPFLRDRKSAADVLTPILEDATKRPLQLQREFSDFHLSLVQTSAARALSSRLQARLPDCQREHNTTVHNLANPSIERQR